MRAELNELSTKQIGEISFLNISWDKCGGVCCFWSLEKLRSFKKLPDDDEKWQTDFENLIIRILGRFL